MYENAILYALAASVVVALIISVAVVLQRKQNALAQLSDSDRARHDQIRVADQELAAAQRAFDSDVRNAHREHDRSVRGAEKALRAAQFPRVLAQAGSVRVTEAFVLIGGHEHPLAPGISAEVSTSGTVQIYQKSRSTLTRTVAGGMVAGPIGAVVGAGVKKNRTVTNDTRQLFLTMTGPGWSEVARLDPHLEMQARQLCARLADDSAHAAEHLAAYHERLASAQTPRDARVHDTARIDAATLRTARLERARQVRDTLGEDPLTALKPEQKAIGSHPDTSSGLSAH